MLAVAPKLEHFLSAPLPAAPPEFHGSNGAAIGMWGNDQYGCCTIAGLANYRAIRAARTGQPAPGSTTDAVVAQYMKLTGGEDTGLVEIDVLNAAKGGLELGGPTWMDAVWSSVASPDIVTCRSLIAIFGALYLGVDLPTDAQNQAVWTPTQGPGGAPGSWGGHCLLWSGYTAEANELVTWGAVKQCSLDWLSEYAEEFHVVVDADSAAVAGIDFAALVNYANETA